jgi:hypothetical protein
MSKLSSKLSKAAIYLRFLPGTFPLPLHHQAFSDQIFVNQTFALFIYLLKFPLSILPVPGSG